MDFVKVDDILAPRLYGIHADENKQIRQAIDKCGRDMVLSLSPGPAPVEHSELFRDNANVAYDRRLLGYLEASLCFCILCSDQNVKRHSGAAYLQQSTKLLFPQIRMHYTGSIS